MRSGVPETMTSTGGAGAGIEVLGEIRRQAGATRIPLRPSRGQRKQQGRGDESRGAGIRRPTRAERGRVDDQSAAGSPSQDPQNGNSIRCLTFLNAG